MSSDEEELVVESVAFTVCGSLGVDTSVYPYSRRGRRRPRSTRSKGRRAMIDRIGRGIEEAVAPESEGE